MQTHTSTEDAVTIALVSSTWPSATTAWLLSSTSDLATMTWKNRRMILIVRTRLDRHRRPMLRMPSCLRGQTRLVKSPDSRRGQRLRNTKKTTSTSTKQSARATHQIAVTFRTRSLNLSARPRSQNSQDNKWAQRLHKASSFSSALPATGPQAGCQAPHLPNLLIKPIMTTRPGTLTTTAIFSEASS